MRITILILALCACSGNGLDTSADLAPAAHPKEGDPCGNDGGAVDPNACGAGYVCMMVGSLEPVCLVLSGPGEHCGGFTAVPRICKPGLTCKSGMIPDAGGTCQ